MSKLKINSGLLSLILVACLFTGWSTMLTVAVLVLIFCEIDERVKNILVRVLTFFAAITLFNLLWDLITGGISLGLNSIDDLIAIINHYLSPENYITLGKLDLYIIEPINKMISLADSVISYIIMFVEFTFAVSLLLNKPGKPNFVIKKIEEYINSIINFVNSFEFGNVQPSVQPQMQPQPMYNQPNMNQMPNQPQMPNNQNFNQPNM